MTRICAIQPYLFPYLPYFQLAQAVDEFWVLDDVQYIRRGFMNRNWILLNGAPHQITFPVATGHRADLIQDKALADGFDSGFAKLKQTLFHAYGAAPYYAQAVAPLLDLARPPGFLDLALETLGRVFAQLRIKTPVRRTSRLGLAQDLRGQDRILAICAAAQAQSYVNPIGGQALYDPASFAARGVCLRFLNARPAPYRQTGTTQFHPNLSILDLLAHVAPASYSEHLGAFTLIAGGAAHGNRT